MSADERELVLAALGDFVLPVLVWDGDLRLVRWSPAAHELFGWQTEDVLHLRPDGWPFLHDDDREEAMAMFRRLRDGERHATLRVRALRRDGETIPCEFACTAQHDGSGRLGAILTIVRRRREDARTVRESEVLARVDTPIVRVTPEGRVREVNNAAAVLLGGAERVRDASFPELAIADDVGGLIAALRRCAQTGERERVERRLDDGHGMARRCALALTPLRDAFGTVAEIAIAIDDIDEVTRVRAELTTTLEALRHEVDARRAAEAETANARRAFAEVTSTGKLVEFLQSARTMSEAYEVVAATLPSRFPSWSGSLLVLEQESGVLEPSAHWGDEALVPVPFAPHECWALRRGRTHTSTDARGLRCPHLSSLPSGIGAVCVPLLAQGETLGILQLAGELESTEAAETSAQTVGEALALCLANLRLRERLHVQTTHDVLTTLPNRRALEDALVREHARASRYRRTFAVLMLDVDHFKRYNDTHGHEAGDTVLRAVGTYLNANVRQPDLPARYGGEEFVVVMPETDLDAAAVKAEQLRTGIRALAGVTISLGVAAYPQDGESIAEVMRAADTALYEAKAAGRNRVALANRVQPR